LQGIRFRAGVVPPTLENFPEDGNWGEYYDTALQQLYLVRNYQGSLIYPNFVSISGTISDAQHGDRSTTTTTMHKFPQISGTITDTQHGARGGGTLHDAATTSTAGFMAAADKTLIDNATSSATANTLVKRDASGGAAFDDLVAATLKVGSAGDNIADIQFGTVTLVNGVGAVTNSTVTANSVFAVATVLRGGPSTVSPNYYITRVAGASFTITGKDLNPGNTVTADVSTLCWIMITPP